MITCLVDRAFCEVVAVVTNFSHDMSFFEAWCAECFTGEFHCSKADQLVIDIDDG